MRLGLAVIIGLVVTPPLVNKREKRACRRCEEQGVVTAPLEPRIIDKGLVSDRIVTDTIINS